MAKRLPSNPGEILLLATMSPSDRTLIEAELSPVAFRLGQVLEKPHEPVDTVYFPISGVGSVIALGDADRRIEAGLFGREGMSGASVVIGAGSGPHETIMQIEGHGRMIATDRLVALFDQSATLRDNLLLFFQDQMVQTSQTALSNGRANLEERLARWILMSHDRIDGNRLELTHEFLSIMLGVRRAGVTVAIHELEGKGLIRAQRGEILILDRDGLEDEARGSYGVPEAEYERLLIRPERGAD